MEAVVEAGELIFVPRGWWHLALNLEESLAITHNYVSAANLGHVLAFLASRSAALVSGCALGDRCAAAWCCVGVGVGVGLSAAWCSLSCSATSGCWGPGAVLSC